MKKRLLWLGALVSVLLFASCSGGGKSKEASSMDTPEAKNATEVMKYYNLSLSVLKNVVKEKEVDAVLGYMEQGGKTPLVPVIAPPTISKKDTAELMNPGNYFNGETRLNLKLNYAGLFVSRAKFYANFDTYLSYLKAQKTAQAKELLDVNAQLSTKMVEYKQNIFDILSPVIEQAELVLLADNPLKEQVMAVRKMSATMLSIVNLYAGKHVMDGMRIDLKTAELILELNAAKKLSLVTGHDQEMKSYQGFLTEVGSFIKKVQKARQKGTYTEEDYEEMMSSYGVSII